MPDETPLTELRHVFHRFGRKPGEGIEVLHDINLGIGAEDAVALLGPSGCGKSTVLRILAGLIKPSSGEVLYRNQPLHGINPAVAMVFQNFALFPWLNVSQNIMLGLKNAGLSEEEQHRRFTHVIELVGLDGYETLLPKELSGGMKQRVGVARAMITKPEILCLDEPFSALDVFTGETLRNEIGRLYTDSESGLRSFALITHNIVEAVYLSRRIIVLAAKPGRIQGVVQNDLPYPRDPEHPVFKKLVDQIHAILTQAMLPEHATEAAMIGTATSEPRRRPIVPIPQIGISEVMGLMRVLKPEPEDVFEVAQRIGKEFGSVVATVQAAEMLGLVTTPGDEVVLTPRGRDLLQANLPRQKQVLQEQMLQLRLFQYILQRIEASENKELSETELHDDLVNLFPNEKIKPLIRTIVQWGRFGELLNHDSHTGMIRRYEKMYRGKPPAERLKKV